MARRACCGLPGTHTLPFWWIACMVALPLLWAARGDSLHRQGTRVQALLPAAYRSERETLDDRATRQSDKLRDRLGWIPGILHGNGPKPKGMHWRTFERLQARHDAYVAVSLAEMGRMLGIMESRLDKIRRR